MIPNHKVLLKVFSPAMLARAARSFDRHALMIIGASWAATIVVMFFALYTINLSVEAKKEAEAAIATEPSLPIINHLPVGGRDLQVMIDRLQRRYPEVSITWQNNTLSIAGVNGGVYHQWLMAIGQVDTLYPQFHWKIKGLCVGKVCGGQHIMTVDLVGDRIAFEMPQDAGKK
jgi:hypothetical protein